MQNSYADEAMVSLRRARVTEAVQPSPCCLVRCDAGYLGAIPRVAIEKDCGSVANGSGFAISPAAWALTFPVLPGEEVPLGGSRDYDCHRAAVPSPRETTGSDCGRRDDGASGSCSNEAGWMLRWGGAGWPGGARWRIPSRTGD